MSMWGNTTDSISSLPYRDVLLSLFSASTFEARCQIIQKDLAVLTAHTTLDALGQDIQQSWEQGDKAMADFLWKMQRLLQRVRDQGIENTVQAYTQPLDQVQDISILIERSATPFQTVKGVIDLLNALDARNERLIFRIIASHEEQFRQPIAAAMIRNAGQIVPEFSMNVPSRLEHAAELLDAIAQDQDVRGLISTWWPSKQGAPVHLSEPMHTVMGFLTTADWHEAQRFALHNYDILLSNSALDALRSAMREAWQSDRNVGIRMWRHLRLLEHARKLGVDVAFNKLIWDPNAEKLWQSDRERRMMEAANIPLGNLVGLEVLITAMGSDDERAINEWAEKYWDDIQHPWVADCVRYIAEVVTIEESLSDGDVWNVFADWLDEIRDEGSQAISKEQKWAGIPNISGLTIL